ncbi:hypothetical protein [Micromonospora siamensis]|uniref:hypothetical protein n=1 Tax=Micromonospora siamensis TaxID=299152 RepID=UPI000B5AF54A|nr:hypothetical protein [Micromonospora siamensis]
MTGPVTKRSFSLPQDVAERLEHEPNASAYVVDAVRARMRAEDLDAELARRGMTVSAEGRARARAQRAQVEQDWSPGRRAALRERSRRAAQEMVEGADRQAPAA